jgi:hypothetical protein
VRGVYDTFPQDHSAGARVYFISHNGQDAVGDYEGHEIIDTGDDSVLLND